MTLTTRRLLDPILLCRPEEGSTHDVQDNPLREGETAWLFRPAILPHPAFLFEMERRPDGTIRLWVESPTRPYQPDPVGLRIHSFAWDRDGRPFVPETACAVPRTVADARVRAGDWADAYSVAAFACRPIT